MSILLSLYSIFIHVSYKDQIQSRDVNREEKILEKKKEKKS